MCAYSLLSSSKKGDIHVIGDSITPSSETKLDTISFLIELPSWLRLGGPASAAPIRRSGGLRRLPRGPWSSWCLLSPVVQFGVRGWQRLLTNEPRIPSRAALHCRCREVRVLGLKKTVGAEVFDLVLVERNEHLM